MFLVNIVALILSILGAAARINLRVVLEKGAKFVQEKIRAASANAEPVDATLALDNRQETAVSSLRSCFRNQKDI
jgi:hypothetical protein